MVKDYKILKGKVFPAPFDKSGVKIKLEQRKAADYVTKGALEELKKAAPKAAKPKAEKKAAKK